MKKIVIQYHWDVADEEYIVRTKQAMYAGACKHKHEIQSVGAGLVYEWLMDHESMQLDAPFDVVFEQF